MSADAGLVLVHGFTGDASSWESVVAMLPPALRRDCRRVELLGHGHSPSTSVQWSEEIERLMTELEDSKGGTLVGYSLGARVALGLLVEAPGRFERAVLIGGQPGLSSAAERSARRQADERLAALLETEGLTPFLELWEALPLFASQRQLPAAILERQRLQRQRQDPVGLARSLRALGAGSMPDLWPRLVEITVPVRLVVGAQDHKFVAIAERMQRALPLAELVVVAGAGHNVVLEAPTELARILGGAWMLEGAPVGLA